MNLDHRFAALRREMEKRGLDAVFVNAPENYLYMSGFDNPDGTMFITRTSAMLYADPRYIEAAKAEADHNCTVCPPGAPSVTDIARTEGVRSVGYEDARLTCAELAGLKRELDGLDVTFHPLGGLFTLIRSYKTEDEVENIVRAQRIAEGAFLHILDCITYEMTEMDVVAELEYYMKKHGSQKPSFDTICVSGTASSRPHGVPRPVRLEKGFLTMDFGAMIKGYHSDMTRTVVIGKADAVMKRLYQTVLDAQRAALDAVTEGASNYEMDKIARDIIYGAGYEGKFGHGLGHGVGLEIHEWPNLSFRTPEGQKLEAGQVVTVEPGIYLEGVYGCRIEDMVYIEPGGSRNLTESPKELIEL